MALHISSNDGAFARGSFQLRSSLRSGLVSPRSTGDNRQLMKNLFCSFLLVLFGSAAAAEKNTAPKFDVQAAERFAKLALGCVEKEYPNKISHVLNSDADVAPPRKLTPAFYGCYDWH